MAEGTTIVLGIVAAFLAIIVFLIGAMILKLDQIAIEMRRRLSHIDNKVTRLEVDHALPHLRSRKYVEGHRHTA